MGERCLGVLTVWSVSRAYGPNDLRLLEELGRRCAFFIENARLHRAQKLATQARDEIMGIVAHDLRNPLSSIILEASNLRRMGWRSGVESVKAADGIEQSALRMNRIIQDLLDVVRCEAGRLTIQRTMQSPAKIITDVVAGQRGLIAEAALSLHLHVASELPMVWADRDRLIQVFENLLGNGMKFTKAGGTLTIGAAARDTEVLFWVGDNGVGIAPENIPHIFDRFWRADKMECRGAGLGLTIVKGIIDAHCGRIWVHSVLGAGSTFYFSIPVAMDASSASLTQ